ncbi:carcinoembryonic antigen-related cell adhesion molecule 1-like [Phyllostomus discolor]|uniref:Carcinoembryonic antigen-related cell adhesion molecule 1-like n=1 Tax=Phyllostomus discolor TaxID=89673 RepID=A0A6J2MZX0_9CHIR|nr:carcinoembryonic antigen-related cell adhesion molecule 1-like [Phyllostomus discolor]
MESLSAPAHRRVPLQGLLLAVSLLTFGSLPSTAQLTVASTNAAEGKDVLLLVLNLPESLFSYNWFRGKSANSSRRIGTFLTETQKFTRGPAHSGRERIYPNGSLLFQKVTLNDTEYYTIVVTKKDGLTEEATGQLRVYRE